MTRHPQYIATTSLIPYTLYRGTFVQTRNVGELEICPNALVGVNPNGVIDFFREGHQYLQQNDVVDFFKAEASKEKIKITSYRKEHFRYIDHLKSPTQFFVPGFIDTHIHASQYPNVGIGLDCPLLDWLNKYTFSLENSFTDDNKEGKMKLAREIYTKVIQKTLSNGTTCASYFTTTDLETTKLFADLLLELGQRGYVGKVCMDHNTSYPAYQESYEDCLKNMKSIVLHCKAKNPAGENLVTPIITPRFAPVCSRKLLRALGELSTKEKLPIQTHISENEEEIELVKELFPECNSYADVYNDHSLLSQATILAHAVHLSPAERKLLKDKKCSISHCPNSNSFITSGEAPVKTYLYEDGINVSLGTDLSGGYDLSILGVMKHSIMVSHHLSMKQSERLAGVKISLADGLYMATQGGAIAVGLRDTLGTFEKGKKFDAQLIDLESVNSNVDVFEWQLPSSGDEASVIQDKIFNLLSKWVFSGDDRNCTKVWCNGRLVVDKHEDERWQYVERSVIV